jgi:hypothetical protein
MRRPACRRLVCADFLKFKFSGFEENIFLEYIEILFSKKEGEV